MMTWGKAGIRSEWCVWGLEDMIGMEDRLRCRERVRDKAAGGQWRPDLDRPCRHSEECGLYPEYWGSHWRVWRIREGSLWQLHGGREPGNRGVGRANEIMSVNQAHFNPQSARWIWVAQGDQGVAGNSPVAGGTLGKNCSCPAWGGGGESRDKAPTSFCLRLSLQQAAAGQQTRIIRKDPTLSPSMHAFGWETLHYSSI